MKVLAEIMKVLHRVCKISAKFTAGPENVCLSNFVQPFHRSTKQQKSLFVEWKQLQSDFNLWKTFRSRQCLVELMRVCGFHIVQINLRVCFCFYGFACYPRILFRSKAISESNVFFSQFISKVTVSAKQHLSLTTQKPTNSH